MIEICKGRNREGWKREKGEVIKSLSTTYLGVGGSVLMSVRTIARNLANSNRSGSNASHCSFASCYCMVRHGMVRYGTVCDVMISNLMLWCHQG